MENEMDKFKKMYSQHKNESSFMPINELCTELQALFIPVILWIKYDIKFTFSMN